jgi:hypothetical protein
VVDALIVVLVSSMRAVLVALEVDADGVVAKPSGRGLSPCLRQLATARSSSYMRAGATSPR